MMPRAYSADLRERVRADGAAGLGRAEAARRYRVGARTVHRWLGALGADGAAAAMTVERATATAVVLARLDAGLIPALARTRPDAVVVMDNLGPHRAPAVRRRLEAAGFEPIDLPRSAPDLSPLEPMGAELKARPRAGAALEAAVGEALARVTADDARGFCRGCGYALPAN
jgi:hypothetical protein